MAANPSFDVSTGCDLQEVDNAVNQALKEIGQRYDFKGTKCEVVFDRPKAEIRLLADDDYRMDALVDVLRTRLVKRNVPVKNLTFQDRETASHGAVRQTVALTQGLSSEIAKRLEEIALTDPYFIEKKLYPNVDFYSGIILKAMGIPTSMFTVIFAVGRTVGWIAHWNEMISGSYRIGRPRQLYTGYPRRDFVPLDKR